jgi:hypothetical protein
MAEIVPIRPDIEIPDELKWIPHVQVQVTDIVSQPHYDIETITRLEKELKNINLDLPAVKSPDIPQIIWVIEQIIWNKVSLQNIHQYLEDTVQNSSKSRNDLQRCGTLLQKIAGIKNEVINWNLIFPRLNLEKKEAA